MNLSDTKSAANFQLDHFIANNLKDYERERNFDFGHQNRKNVSCLSHYISHRVLVEYDIINKILSTTKTGYSEKFIQEILWRIYWRGWLETHQDVWKEFLTEAKTIPDNPNYMKAVKGETEIDFFNEWIRELKNENYLHNHSRMWFASIWIFTLKLPWQLGAAFFMKHLFDGDTASNTLSWRWVAGLQTKGKNYVARKSNIEKFSNIQVRGITLNEFAEPLIEAKTYPFRMPIQTRNTYNRYGTLLIFDNELNISNSKVNLSNYKQIFLLILDNDKRKIILSKKVLEFKQTLQLDLHKQLKNSKIIQPYFLENFCKSSEGIDVLYPFIGENFDYINMLKTKFSTEFNIIYNENDIYCWEFANKGYFNFKKNNKSIMNQISKGEHQ